MRALLVALFGFLFVLPPHAQSAAASTTEETSVSVHARKRLHFEIPVRNHPFGNLATFTFKRSGETNLPLTIYFEVTGTAEQGSDFFRYELEPSLITTGQVQTASFQPGEKRIEVVLSILRDEVREPAEFMRVRVIPPPEGPTYQLRPRRCATVWISRILPCERVVPTPGGGAACIGYRPVPLPRAFFTTARCR